MKVRDDGRPDRLNVLLPVGDCHEALVDPATTSLPEAHGYATAAFASAEEFLRSELLNDTSCLVTDVRMAGLSGVELRRLRESGRRIPTIPMAAYPEEHLRATAMQGGPRVPGQTGQRGAADLLPGSRAACRSRRRRGGLSRPPGVQVTSVRSGWPDFPPRSRLNVGDGPAALDEGMRSTIHATMLMAGN